jgi:hypothetical protein
MHKRRLSDIQTRKIVVQKPVRRLKSTQKNFNFRMPITGLYVNEKEYFDSAHK